MKRGLFSLESFHLNSKNIDGFYKADNFINAIVFWGLLICFL